MKYFSPTFHTVFITTTNSITMIQRTNEAPEIGPISPPIPPAESQTNRKTWLVLFGACLICVSWTFAKQIRVLFLPFFSKCHSPGVNFINIFSWLFRVRRMSSFFWRTNLANGERCLANFDVILALIFSCVKLNGEFFAKSRAPATFCLAHKVWWHQPQLY